MTEKSTAEKISDSFMDVSNGLNGMKSINSGKTGAERAQGIAQIGSAIASLLAL